VRKGESIAPKVIAGDGYLPLAAEIYFTAVYFTAIYFTAIYFTEIHSIGGHKMSVAG
jgi:hypothetical protein